MRDAPAAMDAGTCNELAFLSENRRCREIS
jgi:hypothetical protein